MLNNDLFIIGFIVGGLCVLPIALILHFAWLLVRYKPDKTER